MRLFLGILKRRNNLELMLCLVIYFDSMQLTNEQVREIYPGIKIRKKFAVVDQQDTYLFTLDVQDLKIIDFECDFTGSENITIKSRAGHERIVSKTVEPRDPTLVAQVELHEGWKLQSTFR